ncbi:MAG: tRNA-dihydrouridine synthase, partial [Lachnospiraceae bacterium]|nr:tRNA-dihydrouridine synthase [Lachnospiraceae bacterium]
GKGSGMLADLEKLKRFLDEISEGTEKLGLKLSVKTRIGVKDHSEVNSIAELLTAYPLSEIIVHPRVREDYYANEPDAAAFSCFLQKAECPVCWNGDIFAPEDVSRIEGEFPGIDRVMIGRGLLKDPGLAERIRTGKETDRKRIKAFLADLWDAYAEIMSGERDVLFKMKELWDHLKASFPDNEKAFKKLKKAKNRSEYKSAEDGLIGG